MRIAVGGAALTVGMTGLAASLWGRDAILATVTFGALATGIQVAATRLVAPKRAAPFEQFVRGWAAGMVLRLAGVAMIPFAVVTAREIFPPLPSAAGYLGVLLPLLVWETRLVR